MSPIIDDVVIPPEARGLVILGMVLIVLLMIVAKRVISRRIDDLDLY